MTFERFYKLAWLLIAAAVVYAVLTFDHTLTLDVNHHPASKDPSLDRLLGK